MDQREMWCSGYLRWMRLPEESSTLKPSMPTCGQTASSAAAAGAVWRRARAGGVAACGSGSGSHTDHRQGPCTHPGKCNHSSIQPPAKHCSCPAGTYLHHNAVARPAAVLGQQPHMKALARHRQGLLPAAQRPCPAGDLEQLHCQLSQCAPVRLKGKRGRRSGEGGRWRRQGRRPRSRHDPPGRLGFPQLQLPCAPGASRGVRAGRAPAWSIG